MPSVRVNSDAVKREVTHPSWASGSGPDECFGV